MRASFFLSYFSVSPFFSDSVSGLNGFHHSSLWKFWSAQSILAIIFSVPLLSVSLVISSTLPGRICIWNRVMPRNYMLWCLIWSRLRNGFFYIVDISSHVVNYDLDLCHLHTSRYPASISTYQTTVHDWLFSYRQADSTPRQVGLQLQIGASAMRFIF